MNFIMIVFSKSYFNRPYNKHILVHWPLVVHVKVQGQRVTKFAILKST